MCYCRQETQEDTVKHCNPNCTIQQFHLSFLGIDTIPKTWYYSNCRTLPEFKQRGSKHQSASIISEALRMNSICTCKTAAEKNDKLVKYTNMNCTNGQFLHLSCLGRTRMPNDSKCLLCPTCMINNTSILQYGAISLKLVLRAHTCTSNK